MTRPKICLAMIVKDEASIIARCLNAARRYFDQWIIVDTGSTDETESVIRETLKDVPGEIHRREWRGFGDAKTEALRLAREALNGDGYALVLDADELLQGELPSELTLDRYHVWYQINNVRWTSVRLFRLNRAWRYEGVLHEFPTSDEPTCTESTLDITITTPRDGARSKNPRKYQDDAKLLDNTLLSFGEINSLDPRFALATRYIFYLAQSYRDSGEHKLAIENYLKRAEMGAGYNWEEIYIALLEAARCYDYLGQHQEADRTYLRAHHAWPGRAEALRSLRSSITARAHAAEANPVGTLFVESGEIPLGPRPVPRSPYRLVHQDLNNNQQMQANASNAMEELFYHHRGLPSDKWHHYLEIYERHLSKWSRLNGAPARLLEIGVQGGGSLQIWRKYLGKEAVIHGLDIDPTCKKDSSANAIIHIGDQADSALLTAIVEQMGGVDIVIDDGGHFNPSQIKSFETLYPLLSENGIYICEDVHTSYWPAYKGGRLQVNSFVEFSKRLIDRLHAWYIVDGDGDQSEGFARCTNGVFFYDSMVVVQKQKKTEPKRSVVGAAVALSKNGVDSATAAVLAHV